MSEKINAAQDIRNLARLYQAMINAADMLESIGTYEQALQESKDALEKSSAELKIAQDRVKAENVKVVDYEAASANIVEDTRIHCDEILKNAKAQAESIQGDAIRAAELTSQHADEVASIALQASQEKVTALYDIIKVKTDTLNSLADQIKNTEIELQKLSQVRETARLAVEKLLAN